MRIIKQGSLPEDTIHTGTCNRCKTEVEFKRSEGRVVDDQRDGSFVHVSCPVCGNTIYSAIKD